VFRGRPVCVEESVEEGFFNTIHVCQEEAPEECLAQRSQLELVALRQVPAYLLPQSFDALAEVLPGSQVPRKMKLNMDSKGAMHQWLALAEKRCGITDHDDAQMITNNGRELSALAKAIREQTPNVENRVQSMSGGEVLCTALIAWLRDGDDSLEVSQKVVEMVWPKACAGWPQTQHSWKSEGATKLELLSEIETELRKCGARCQQHLTRLGYYCPHCQHGSCTVCNDIEGRTQCPRCQTPFPHMTPVHRQQVRTHARAPPCLNLHALGEQWIGEVSDVDIVQTPQEDSHEGDQLIFKAHIRGWETDVRRIRCQSLRGKSDLALRQALLRPGWKDILLIPQHWYPADSPKFETKGWWYAGRARAPPRQTWRVAVNEGR